MDLVRAAGWSEAYEALATSEGPLPERIGRISSEHRGGFTVLTNEGERLAQSPAGLRRKLHDAGEDKPVVGDWVGFEEPSDGDLILRAVLPRKTRLRRKKPGSEKPQVLVANVDYVLVVTSVGRDLNPRRIERYLALILDGGATPIVVLTKADLESERDAALALASEGAPNVRTILTSAVTGEGIDDVRALAGDGVTIAMLGSSGVGKSSLANALLGSSDLAVGEVRDDGKGRHTTTRRELVRLPQGGVLIDSPGMRELALYGAEAGVSETFPEVEQAASQCRFSDCRHEREPGCAVRTALERGDITADRFDGWRKLTAELAEGNDPVATAQEQKRMGKVMGRALRARLRDKGRKG